MLVHSRREPMGCEISFEGPDEQTMARCSSVRSHSLEVDSGDGAVTIRAQIAGFGRDEVLVAVRRELVRIHAMHMPVGTGEGVLPAGLSMRWICAIPGAERLQLTGKSLEDGLLTLRFAPAA